MLKIREFELAQRELEESKVEFRKKLKKLKKKVQDCCDHTELSKFVAEPTERLDVNYPISYRCLKCGKHWGYFNVNPKLEPNVVEIVNILGLTLRYIKKS